jgi:predicted PurR-regulated permease PerM
MPSDRSVSRELRSEAIIDVAVRLGIVAFLVIMCARIFAPFMALVLWALILAVTLYPLHQRLAQRLAGRQGHAATLLVLAGLLLIGAPTLILGSLFASDIQNAHASVKSGTFAIKAPSPQVAEWPLVGKKIYPVWEEAARDLPGLMEKMQPQLRSVSKSVLGVVASTAGALLKFIGSLIIAGIMMAYGRAGSGAMLRITNRLAGAAKGPALFNLCTATIRSVAMGVIGVAFIQALLLGGGFVAAGVPAAGILAFIVLLAGIAQLPALLITLPVVAYLWWSGDSVTTNVVFTIYLIVAGMADNVLKPLMLGRGVDAPMPIILIGALGGMVLSGILGLFIGAVFMALGYETFMAWVAAGDSGEELPTGVDGEPAPLPAGVD